MKKQLLLLSVATLVSLETFGSATNRNRKPASTQLAPAASSTSSQSTATNGTSKQQINALANQFPANAARAAIKAATPIAANATDDLAAKAAEQQVYTYLSGQQ